MAFHITPDIEESVAKTQAQELEALIASGGGSVTSSREPKRIHLSYPLQHKHYAYFGVINFESPADGIEPLNTNMKLQEGILRFMILKKQDAGVELRTFGEHRPRSTMRTHVAPVAPIKKEESSEPKQIEKELEDVLEKI